MIRDQRGVGGSRRAAAHRVVDDAHVAEARFFPAQPDGGGAVGHRLDAARGQRRRPHGGRRCWTCTKNVGMIFFFLVQLFLFFLFK